MAHFYGKLDGKAKTTASRTGTKSSGLMGFVQGWNIGGEIVIEYDEQKCCDVVHFYLNKGSNGSKRTLIATFSEDSTELTNSL